MVDCSADLRAELPVDDHGGLLVEEKHAIHDIAHHGKQGIRFERQLTGVQHRVQGFVHH